MELLLFLSSLLLLVSPLSSTPTTTITPSDTIQRTQTQQLLATIPSTSPQPNQPFLTSPSATYTAYLCRTTAAASSMTGDLTNSFCYIQVQETSTGKSVWNSECTPVSAANACALAFADVGLELYDGSHAVWDTGIDGVNSNSESSNYSNNNNYYYYLSALTLDDEGDMQLADSNGEPVWKSSSETQGNQGCGLPGSQYGQNGQQSSGMSLSPPVDISSSSLLPPPSASDEIIQPPSPATSELPGSPASIFSSPASPELPIASPPASSDLPGSPELPLASPPASSDLPGSPELPLASPPAFATPIAGGRSGGVNGNLPFGQQQLQGGNGLNQALVDHNAYDSGSSKEGVAAAAMGLVLVTVGLFVHGFGW